jgi:hypothetical protein
MSGPGISRECAQDSSPRPVAMAGSIPAGRSAPKAPARGWPASGGHPPRADKHAPRERAPRCPVHLAVEMRLASGWRPSFVSVGAVAASERARKRGRKFWRCPVAGCARVAAAVAGEPEDAE